MTEAQTSKPEFTQEELEDAFWGYPPEGYEVVVEGESLATRRWHTLKRTVLKRLSDETYWQISKRVGSTELQEHEEAELDGEVFRTERMVVDYE